ncbi:MAG: BMP family protein [Thermostichus sp. DG02_5_bins_236]
MSRLAGFRSGYVREWISRLALAVALLGLFGLGRTTQAQASGDISGMKLAIILGGTANDGSWNQVAADGGRALQAKGVEVAIVEQIPDPDVKRVLRQYAEQDFDLIIGHSFNHQDAVFAVAEDFPEVNFSWGGAIGRVSENVSDYDQPFHEGAYLVGILAGELSQTGKLGALYGFEIPVCKAMGNALLAGAQLVNSEAMLTDVAVGDWYDVGRAKEAALAQAETGVDFWIGCGQGPTWGSIEAAKEIEGFSTGYVGNMTALGPEVVVTNIVWNLEPTFEQMLKDIQAGTYAEQYYSLGVAEDAVRLEFNPAFEGRISPDTLALYEATLAKIQKGELEVPFQPN